MKTHGDDFDATRNGKEGSVQDNASTFHGIIKDRGKEGERKQGARLRIKRYNSIKESSSIKI